MPIRRLARRRRRLPLFRGPRDLVITRVCSTNSGNGNPFPMFLSTNAVGRHQFTAGTTTAINTTSIAFQFFLAGFEIRTGLNAISTATVPGLSEFGALFDAYHIDMVELMVIPSYNTQSGNAATGALQFPFIIYALDFDDATDQPWSEIAQKQGAKYTQFLIPNGAPVRPLIRFTPKPQLAAYRSGVNFAYLPSDNPNQFINTAYNDVPHYGLKMALDDSNGNLTANLNMAQLNFVCKFHYRFRGIQ